MLRNKYKIGRESIEDTDIIENPVEVESDVNTADAVDPNELPVEDLLHYEEDMATIKKLDFDISQVVDAADEGNELAKEVTEGLERAADLVAGKAENDPIDAIATQESLKYLFKRAGLEYNPSKFNLEDATSNLQLANSINLEFFKELATGIKEGAVKVYEYLVELLTKLWKYISGIFYKEGKKYLDIKASARAVVFDLSGLFETDVARVENILDRSLIDTFETEFGRTLSQNEMQKISDWNKVTDKRLIIAALREASAYQHLNLGYIEKILSDWKQKKITADSVGLEKK